MCAGVYQTEFADVHFLGQNAGGHIGDQNVIAHVRNARIFRAVDRVVVADMYVIRVVTDHIGRNCGNVRKILVCRGSDQSDIAVFLRLDVCFLRELTRHNVIGFSAAVHKVERNGGKLRGRAALKKEHFIILGNVHQFAEVFFRLFDDGFVVRRSMAHLHDRHA